MIDMGQYRTPSKKSRWYLPKDDYLTAVHYALRYPKLLASLPPANSGSAIRYDRDRVQSSEQYDATSALAMKRLEIKDKLELIDWCIHEVANGQDDILRRNVCYGVTYYQLRDSGYLGSAYEFGQMRQKFYYLLIEYI